MKAIALDRFGGPEVLTVPTLPVPEIGPDEVLIRVEAAGVGQWDPFEREGGFARLAGVEPEPQGRPDVTIQGDDGAPDPQTFAKRNRLIAAGPFEAHVARVFPLEQAAEEPVASSV